MLSIKGLGLGIGFSCAIFMFLMGLIAISGYGLEWVNLIAKVYIGYDASFFGAILGAIYGFIDGFIFGALTSFFYNRFK